MACRESPDLINFHRRHGLPRSELKPFLKRRKTGIGSEWADVFAARNHSAVAALRDAKITKREVLSRAQFGSSDIADVGGDSTNHLLSAES